MRYAEEQFGEEPIAIGIFEAGDTVNIKLVDLEANALIPVTASGCTELTDAPGFYTWHTSGIQTPLSGFHQCLYIMENQQGRQHPGKIVVGGYPSDSARARYEGFIHIDVASGEAGTDYDLGTPTRPVNNVPDARAIALARNIKGFLVRGSITVSGNYSNWSFEGVEPTDDVVTFAPGAVTAGAQFFQMGVRGTLSGAVTCQECLVGDAGVTSGLAGIFNTCGVIGTLQVTGPFQALEIASRSLIPGTTLDLSAAGAGTTLLMGGAAGIFNLTGVGPAQLVGVTLKGGTWYLQSSCDGGFIQLYGYGEVVDNSAGSSVTDLVLKGSHLQGLYLTDVPAVAADVERLYGQNTRTRLWYADAAVVSGVAGAERNVPAGVASHMETQVKTDAQADWSSPATYHVVFNYAADAGENTPPASAEPALTAPTDGSFSAEPYPA